MSGCVWPESVVEAVKGAINPLVPNSDGVLWMFTHEDGQEQPITLDNVATAALDAAADALAVDAEGEVARLRDEVAFYKRQYGIKKDRVKETMAERDAAEARLAEVAEWVDEAPEQTAGLDLLRQIIHPLATDSTETNATATKGC